MDEQNSLDFFSTSNIDELFSTLVSFWKLMTNDYEIELSSYAVRANILDNDHKLMVNISILKIPEEEKYWVELIQEQGSRLSFNKLFKTLKGYFGGHVNAVY